MFGGIWAIGVEGAIVVDEFLLEGDADRVASVAAFDLCGGSGDGAWLDGKLLAYLLGEVVLGLSESDLLEAWGLGLVESEGVDMRRPFLFLEVFLGVDPGVFGLLLETWGLLPGLLLLLLGHWLLLRLSLPALPVNWGVCVGVVGLLTHVPHSRLAAVSLNFLAPQLIQQVLVQHLQLLHLHTLQHLLLEVGLEFLQPRQMLVRAVGVHWAVLGVLCVLLARQISRKSRAADVAARAQFFRLVLTVP